MRFVPTKFHAGIILVVILWVLTIAAGLSAIWVIVVTWWLWISWENREAERRRTAPERARRAGRRLEIDALGAWGEEDYLRRILIGDLRAIVARRKAQAYIEEMLRGHEQGDAVRGDRPQRRWHWPRLGRVRRQG